MHHLYQQRLSEHDQSLLQDCASALADSAFKLEGDCIRYDSNSEILNKIKQLEVFKVEPKNTVIKSVY